MDANHSCMVVGWHVGTDHGLSGVFCVLSVLLLRERHLQQDLIITDIVDKESEYMVDHYSVMMASKRLPHRHGWFVTSKVQRSMIRDATSYCAAARRMPGVLSAERVGTQRYVQE
jgi:hypothetical protein